MIVELIAPPNRRLCRAGDVGVELGAEDHDFRKLVDQISSEFVTESNRPFAKTTYRETIARTISEIDLIVNPVASIVQVLDADGEVVPVSGYGLVDAARGLLKFRNQQVAGAFDSVITIDYIGGYVLPDWPGEISTLPAQLERAAIEATKALYAVIGGGVANIKSERIGDYAVSYGDSQAPLQLPQVRSAVLAHRRWNV